MKNRVIVLEREFGERAVRMRAEDHLMRICGLDPAKREHRELREEAEQVGNRWLPQVRLSAVLSSYPQSVIAGERASLNGVSVSCQALGYFPREAIRKVFVYLLTLGPDALKVDDADQAEKETLSTAFYQDAWGTAMIDGGRDLLREWIGAREEPSVISDSFGPGYYGMGLEQVDSFFSILNGDLIGARRGPGGVIWPPKACAGFYLVLEPGSHLPSDGCRSCIGDKASCRFCRNWSGNAGENSV